VSGRSSASSGFSILPTEWTVDSEELTPTLKLKRRVIKAKYGDEIEDLYRSQ
jgi:long-chain acyl-CoA synthetase